MNNQQNSLTIMCGVCISPGGGGITAILSEGEVFSKTNVDLSIVTGKLPMAVVEHLHQAARITTSLDDSKNGSVTLFTF